MRRVVDCAKRRERRTIRARGRRVRGDGDAALGSGIERVESSWPAGEDGRRWCDNAGGRSLVCWESC